MVWLTPIRRREFISTYRMTTILIDKPLVDAEANEERQYEAGLLDPWISFPVFDSKDGLGWGESRG